jgi:hypothetical protein
VRTRILTASSKIGSHACIKRQAAMVLTRVNMARLAYDVRTFECFNCANVDKVMVETKRGSAAYPFPICGSEHLPLGHL